LKLRYDAILRKEDIRQGRFNMWRYEAAYPMAYEEITITFDEGLTPLVAVDWDGFPVHVKLESLMPTGSFKDRGTVMAINYMKNRGVSHITEDSSGNAASSVAAYSARGGLTCAVYVPAGNSSGKITQAKALHAEVHPTPGTRDEVAQAAQVHVESYAGHNWHPMFEPGYKSIAYEIWEQSDFVAPDAIFTPCGGGGLTLGLVEGFRDLLRSGQIPRVPKIYAVQPENCNPIYRAFRGIEGEFTPAATVAEGTSIAKPIKKAEIVEGVRGSGGAVLAVTDDEILEVLPRVWRHGIYIEPTSGSAFAAFARMLASGEIGQEERVVIMASGNGLKASDKIQQLL